MSTGVSDHFKDHPAYRRGWNDAQLNRSKDSGDLTGEDAQIYGYGWDDSQRWLHERAYLK